MSFTSQYQIDFDNLEATFKPETITIVWETAENIEKDRRYFENFLNKKNGEILCMISPESPFLPFLSTEDNLLIGINKNRKEVQQELYQMMEFLQVDRHVLQDEPCDLPDFLRVELQLARSLLRKQKLIVIDTILDVLPVQQVQLLLNLFRHFAKDGQFAILLFTTNQQIADSSYGDVTIPLLQ